MKQLLFDVERCDGCRDCEAACAIEHSASKNRTAAASEVPAPQTRIHVEPIGEHALVTYCLHCADAPCVIACPNGAMTRDPSGRVFVDEDRCQGCFMCAMVCPFGSITANTTTRVSLKCDLCPDRLRDGRELACVEACPTRALRFVDEHDVPRTRKKALAAKLAEGIGITKPRQEPDMPQSTPHATAKVVDR